MASLAQVDPNFEKQVRQLRSTLAAEAQSRLQGRDAVNYTPVLNDWSGDLTDLEGMASAFSREELNQTYEQMLDDPEKGGVVGDAIAIAFQVDWLALLERAYRARHTMNRCRSVAHATARRQGQGLEDGVLSHAYLEYLRGVLRQSKVA